MGYFWSPYLEIAIVIGLILLGIAAPSHFRARNTGTILLICWAFTANLFTLINKLVWYDHDRNIAPLWCDISTKLEVGFSVSTSACTLVINRRLYKISKISSVVVTPAQQRRDLITDLSIALGIPTLVMIMHVVVQGHRANIIQGLGCYPTFYNTPPAYPLVFMWPLVLSSISVVFGMLSLRAWLIRRSMVEEFLNSTGSGLNADRYFRLMCFSAVELTINFPLSLWVMLTNLLSFPMFQWISWDDTHYMFNRFDQIAAALIEADPTTYNLFLVNIWAHPFICYLFFIFFGFGREQINQYKRWFYAALKPFGVKPPPPKPSKRERRSWWQGVFRLRLPPSAHYDTDLNSSHGPTDSLPAFRPGAAQVGSFGERPIPSARSNAPPTLDTTMTFDLDQYDERAEAKSDIVDSKPPPVGYNVNKPLPPSPTVVVDSLGERDGDGEYSRRTTVMSTSSASSVAGSSRRLSEALRDVELSEEELRAIEARIQRMP